MSDDVAALINRAFYSYLEPPDQQPATCLLNGAINDTATTVLFESFVVPEDEELLKVGIHVEIDSELLRLVSYDELTMTAVVSRAQLGSTAAAHTDGSVVKITPSYPRIAVFQAVADNIIGLYPELSTVNTDYFATVAGNVVPLNDDLAVEVVDIWPGASASGQRGPNVSGRIVDYHPSAGGRAVVLDNYSGSVWVRYRRRFGDASAETDTWVDLGLEARWGIIVVIGACADLFAGRDLPASHVEWASNVLQAENIRVGSRLSLAGGLAQYRNILIDRAKSEMRAEYKAKVRVRTVNAW